MDFEHGLDALKRSAEGTDWYQDFTVHESALRENLGVEHRYGPSEQIRHDRARIVDQLNALTLKRLGVSFNGLCLPAESRVQARSSAPSDQPWHGGAETTVQNQIYVLHDPVDEVWATDRSFVRRHAKAWQPDTDRLVWLKQVRVVRATPAATQMRDALDYEGRLFARLERQADFPRLLALEKNNEAVVIAFAFIPGPTLAQAFGPLGKSLEADRAYRLLRCLRPLCTALAALHREGVYHRHLTPEDVVLLEGRRDHAVLRDFGLAAHPRTPDEGPALYRAPEQARMSAPTLPGPHTDIYQLAALLYHFLTGRAPTSFLSEIEPPSVWNRSLSAELDAALLRALAEAPTDRWPSMNTFCVALAQAAARLRSRLRESP